jgi:ribosomal protein S12 methylthiotransferase accessory factor
MSIQISFPGGVTVAAQVDDFTIMTDQPVEDGGQGSAPAPYDLFLASIGTCAGFYVLRFCAERDLPTEGLGMSLDIERDPESRKLLKVMLDIKVPENFPAKYHQAVIRAAGLCSVKKALTYPPEFELTVS